MSFLQINYFSPSIWRQTTFHMCFPNDTPPELKEGNKCYERPMKTLMLLQGYSGNTFDWPLGSLISDIALRYNIAVIMPSGDNSFYTNAKGCCYKCILGILGEIKGVSHIIKEFKAHKISVFVAAAFGIGIKAVVP